MKVATVGPSGEERVAVQVGDAWIDFSEAAVAYSVVTGQPAWLDRPSMLTILQCGLFSSTSFQTVVEWLRAHSLLQSFVLGGEIKFDMPVQRPGKIIGIGRNFLATLPDPKPPYPRVFLKATSACANPGDPVRILPETVRIVPEVEMAVVIGRCASGVSVEDAYNYVAGYTVFNDVSNQLMLDAAGNTVEVPSTDIVKGGDTQAPFGPCIVTLDELGPNPALDLTMTVSGKLCQQDNTRNYYYKIPDVIAHVSHFMTLEPGDIITMGTPVIGFPVKAGDVMVATVEGIGTITNPVVAAAADMPPRC